MSNDGIKFVDTTIRDGHQSLWAENMTTGMMLPTLRHLDEAGFDSIEFFLQQRFKKFVREHKEDPWDWLRLGTKEIKKTRLRYHGGIHSGFEFIPECIRKLVIKTVAKYGVDLTRTSSFWNDFDELDHETKELRELGMEAVVNLIYSISPRHTDEYYANKICEAFALDDVQVGQRHRTAGRVSRIGIGVHPALIRRHVVHGLFNRI